MAFKLRTQKIKLHHFGHNKLRVLVTALAVATVGVWALALSSAASTHRYSPYTDLVVQGPGGFDNFEHRITLEKVDNIGKAAYYWARDFSFSADSRTYAYIGIQGTNKAVFSVFYKTPTPSSTTSPNCLTQQGNYDGGGADAAGTACLIPFSLTQGRTYQLRVANEGERDNKITWGGWVKDLTSGREVNIGYIQVPSSWGRLSKATGLWTEYFGDGRNCKDLPRSSVVFFGFKANNGQYTGLESHNSRVNDTAYCHRESRVSHLGSDHFRQEMSADCVFTSTTSSGEGAACNEVGDPQPGCPGTDPSQPPGPGECKSPSGGGSGSSGGGGGSSGGGAGGGSSGCSKVPFTYNSPDGGHVAGCSTTSTPSSSGSNPCPSGYYRVDSSHCCPNGWTYDGAGRCNTNDGGGCPSQFPYSSTNDPNGCCPQPGMTYTATNSNSGTCSGGQGGGSGCPSGQNLQSNDTCCPPNDVRVAPGKCCPAGQTYNGSGCVGQGGGQCPPGYPYKSTNDPNNCCPQPSMSIQGGKCTCPAGQGWNGSACVQGGQGGGQTCPQGYSLQQDACCPQGHNRVAAGKCCPQGYTFDGTNCRSGGGGTTCPPQNPHRATNNPEGCCPQPNMTINTSTNPPTCACPSGQTWNGKTCAQQQAQCRPDQDWNGSSCVQKERVQPYGPTATSACDNGKAKITLTWSEGAKTGNVTYIDFDTDNDWNNGYNGNVGVGNDGTSRTITNGVEVNLTPGSSYRLRAYYPSNTNGFPHSGNGAFTAQACSSPTPSTPSASVSCVSGKAVASIRWEGSGITYVDIDNNTDWNSGYWNKAVSGNSTTAPDGFSGPSTLTFNPNVMYYLRTYNGSTGQHSATTRFPGTNCTPATPSSLTISQGCGNNGLANATISWQGSAQYVDIDDNNDWNSGHWNKAVTAGFNQTVAPDGFTGPGTLNFVKGVTYYVRVYNSASSPQYSATVTFVAKDCRGPAIQIVGRTFWKGNPAGNVTIEDCNGHKVTSGSDGYYRIDLEQGKGFCVRATNRPLGSVGPVVAAQSNPEHAGVASYEYQIAGVNCYHNKANPPCGPDHQTWDRNHSGQFEYGYDFTWEGGGSSNTGGGSTTPANNSPQPAAAPGVVTSCNGSTSTATIYWTDNSATYIDIDNNNNWNDGFWHKAVSASLSGGSNSTTAPDGFGRYGANSDLVLIGNATYYARSYNGSNGLNSAVVSFVAKACAQPPPPAAPAATTSCNNGASIATIYWQDAQATYVDVDNNNNWSDGFWHKAVSASLSGGSNSTTAPDGFGAYGASTQLQFYGGSTYYVRTYNGSTKANSGVSSFIAKTCEAPPKNSDFDFKAPPGSPGAPTATTSCNILKQSKATISWAGTGVTNVDIDNNNNWDDGFWNKSISYGTNSTPAPDGFNPYGASTQLTLIGGYRYYMRTYSINNGLHSATGLFVAQKC